MNLIPKWLRRKELPRTLAPAYSTGGGGWGGWDWWGVIKESFTGAWQRDIEISATCVLAQTTVFSCVTLITGDISKLRIKLVKQNTPPLGIWKEVSSPAFSPVLTKPNKFQNRIDFFEQWVLSKLRTGNTYVLKVRDGRGLVVQMYVLDPGRVVPLVSEDGQVFYQLSPDNIAGGNVLESVVVPASEIMHDRFNCLFHPLIGLSPIFACGLAATQALEIQRSSTRFFKNGAKVGGILTVPGAITKEKAEAMSTKWNDGYTGENAGKVAVLGDGVKFQQLTMTSADAQAVEQLKLAAEQVCSTFHIPAYMVGVGQAPAYNNIEALNQQYYTQCLQKLIEQIELCLDEGLGLLAAGFGSEFDITQLLRMDTAARYEAHSKGIGAGFLKPNDARRAEDLDDVEGGDDCYLQEQNFSLKALAKRDAQDDPWASRSTPPAAATPPPVDDEAAADAEDEAADDDEEARAFTLLFLKELDANFAQVPHGGA